MVPTLAYSKNYCWTKDDILGKGATSIVYRGVNRSTGENVAVKVVTQLQSLREFEVLKKVNHENIVKLIAIEQEDTGRLGRNDLKRHIIVTELCTGGCLDRIIQQPEHMHGLTDSEFLTVLKHLYQGIRYLRENDLVHRDLKPGNIMKFIKDDGSVVYKLIDFGAARELPDEAEFNSFYGTEEYLAPDMYQKAFLNKHGNLENMTFQATVDLWSIGATLYHIATGRLPFVPFGGRQNRDKAVMHYITKNKGSGVISGVQKDLKKLNIHWSKELPEDCLLSTGLKKIITPLLAGLLESDNNKIWSFEKFFHQVEVILSKKVVHVFYVNSPSLSRVYLDRKSTIEQLQHEVSSQIQVHHSTMYFIYKSSLLAKQEKIPRTTEYSPVFLIHFHDPRIHIFPLTTLSQDINFTINADIKEDYSQAKKACATGFVIHRDIEQYTLYSKLICDIVENLTHYTKREFWELEKQNRHLLKMMKNLKRTMEIFEFSKKISSFNDLSTQTNEDLKKISDEFDPISRTISAMNKKYNGQEFVQSQWVELTKGLEVNGQKRHVVKSKTLVDQLDNGRQNLKINSGQPQSSDYLIEKKRCRQSLSRISDLLKYEVHPRYKALFQRFEDWYKALQVDLLKIEILNSIIKEIEVTTEEFEEKLDIDHKNYKEQFSARSAKKPSSISWRGHNGEFKNLLKNNRPKSKDILKENMTISAVWNDFLIANESFLLEKAKALERLSFTED